MRCRNPNLNEEGALLQLQGHSEHACWEAAGMRKSSASLEYSGIPQNYPEQMDRDEEEEEVQERPGASPCSDAGTDAFLAQQLVLS